MNDRNSNNHQGPPAPSAMGHPAETDWMEWLYGESPAGDHQRLQAHLETCAQCQERVARWQAVMQQLNTAVLPKAQPFWPRALPLARWAAAAVLVLGLGIWIGRWSNDPSRQFAAWRQQLQAEWRQEMRQANEQLRARMESTEAEAHAQLALQTTVNAQKVTEHYLRQFGREYATAHQNDLAWLTRRVQSLESQRKDDNSLLRQDLETLALTAEDEFQKTRQQIGNLLLLTRYPSEPNTEGQQTP